MRLLILSLLAFTTVTFTNAQTQRYSGTWTKVLTTYAFDFDLILKVNKSNQVEGHFIWKVVHYDEYNTMSIEYYEDKIGLSAKEFVRGTYDPVEQEYVLQGYKKKDPHAIIGMDTYKLKVDELGSIKGITSAEGTWLGRIEPRRYELDHL